MKNSPKATIGSIPATKNLKMFRLRQVLVFGMMCLLLTGGCGDRRPEIVEEDKDAPLRFRRVRMEENVRKGRELGLRVWAQVEDSRADLQQFHLRFGLRDSLKQPHQGNIMVAGQVFVPITDEASGDTLCWEYQPAMLPGSVRKFDAPDTEMPPLVEFFLPYHWLNLSPGHHQLFLDMEAVEGTVPEQDESGFPGQWEQSGARERQGFMQVKMDMELPQLYAMRLVVQLLELDTDKFDPHEMDFYLIKVNPNYGYPDLFWSMGIGYENAFDSDYYHNSVSGNWPDGSGVVYVKGPEEVVSLCALDWDDERVFNNSHDEIGCWEGKLSELSRDSLNPTRLSFHHVKRMDVYVDWIEE